MGLGLDAGNQVDHVWCKEILAQLSGHPALESLSLDGELALGRWGGRGLSPHFLSLW